MPKCCNDRMSYMPDRIRLEQDTSADAAITPVYTTFRERIPCRISPGSASASGAGNEGTRGVGQQLESHAYFVIVMRYLSGVLTTMRAVVTSGIYKDRVLNIEVAMPIQEPGQAPWMELRCTELVPAWQQ